MKHLILAAALLGFTATTSLAQGSSWPAPPTAAQVQALKSDLITAKNSFEANVTANKKSKAEADATALMKLMSRHIVHTRLEAEASGSQRTQIMQHMSELESYYAAFQHKADDVMGNGNDLIGAANDYIAHF